MNRGQRVRVLTKSGQYVPRIVWSDQGKGILICTEEGYIKAQLEEDEPVCVGFPRKDVEEVN